MWFGTLKGLNRYDGTSFKIFLNNRGDSNSIPNNHIVHIEEDKEGMLWLNADGVMCRFDPSTEKVVRIYRELTFSVFFIDSYKRLWIVDSRTVRQFDYNKDTFIQYSVPAEKSFNHEVQFLGVYEDNGKNLWATSLYGIYRMDTLQKNMTHYLGEIHTPFSVLYQDQEKNFWAGFWPGGLQKLSVSENKLIPVTLKDTLCPTLTEWNDSYGNDWLIAAFTGGIKLIDTKTGRSRNYPGDRNYTESHNISTFPNLYKDKENRIWICHTNGVDIIDPFLQGVTNIYPVNSKNDADKDWGNAGSFYESKDEYWISRFNNKGISVYTKKWELKRTIPLQFHQRILIRSQQISMVIYGMAHRLVSSKKNPGNSLL
jgi:ligand-binding sensor domain-containing protein